MQTKTDFITVLKKKGLKVTKHRNSLLEVLEIENQPLTAEDIFLKLKEKGISINLSSVYRILDTLVDNNLINKLIMDNYQLSIIHYQFKKAITILIVMVFLVFSTLFTYAVYF